METNKKAIACLVACLLTIVLLASYFEDIPSDKKTTSFKGKCGQFTVYSGLARYKTGYDKNLVGFDDDGVIIYLKENVESRYHYSLISRWGLTALKHYCKTGHIPALESAMAQANYLVENYRDSNDFVTWIFDFPGGGNRSGFSSGISNGAIIDLLLHLGYVTKETKFTQYAILGANSFKADIEHGGIAFPMKGNTGVFFEEYAVKDAKVKHILNGHLLAMMHLRSYLDNYRTFFSEDAHFYELQKQFSEAIKSVQNYMHDFDAKTKRYGRTTYYDLHRVSVKSADAYPHRIHVCGLYWIFNLTNDRSFYQLASKWDGYRTNKKPIGCTKEKDKAIQLHESLAKTQ